MADDNELTLKDPAAGKKKKLIMIVALAVILLGGGGAGAWFMLPAATNRRPRRGEAKPKPRRRPSPRSMWACCVPSCSTWRVVSGIGWCRSRSS
jgi:flagellar FliL protein